MIFTHIIKKSYAATMVACALTNFSFADNYCCETPPACVQDCNQFCNPCSGFTEGVYVDFLWWKVEGQGLDLGKNVLIERAGLDPSTGNYANVTRDSKVKSLDFKYEPGFRIGLWFSFPRKKWDIVCAWTQLNTKAEANGTSHLDPNSPPGNIYDAFVPYWETLAQNFPDHCHGKWELNINVVDAEFGREYGITSCFLIRPYFGLRFAQLDQEYKVKSDANQSGSFNSATYVYTSEVNAKNSFAGIGPRLGCDVELQIPWGFALFGKGAGSLVYGRFDSHSHEDFQQSDFYFYLFDDFQSHAHHSKLDWRSRVITDFSIGLKYENAFYCGCRKFPFSLAVSWEHHAFYNFNDLNFNENGFTNTSQGDFEFGPYANVLPSYRKTGNLYTQGLTVSLEVGF